MPTPSSPSPSDNERTRLVSWPKRKMSRHIVEDRGIVNGLVLDTRFFVSGAEPQVFLKPQGEDGRVIHGASLAIPVGSLAPLIEHLQDFLDFYDERTQRFEVVLSAVLCLNHTLEMDDPAALRRILAENLQEQLAVMTVDDLQTLIDKYSVIEEGP